MKGEMGICVVLMLQSSDKFFREKNGKQFNFTQHGQIHILACACTFLPHFQIDFCMHI